MEPAARSAFPRHTGRATIGVMEQELRDLIADLREAEALERTRALLEGGTEPGRILEETREGMRLVGQRYESGRYFLPELLMAGEILRQIAEIVRPGMRSAAAEGAAGARVVIGTVKGDIHDIGKSIVTFMLDAAGFEVHDLGIDVPPERFVASLRELRPRVLALSGFLTLAFGQMRATVGAVAAAGLRVGLKVMIGGAQMDDRVVGYVGADAWGPNAVAAVDLARRWTGGK